MKSNKSRIIAIIGTLLFHVALFFISFFYSMDNTVSELFSKEWPPQDSSEILFGGEYVMIGDTYEPSDQPEEDNAASSTQSEEVSIEADDMTDEGAIGDPVQPVTSTEESPVEIVEKPAQTTPGTTKEMEEPKTEKPSASQASNSTPSVTVTFNTPGSGNGSSGGKDKGQKEGNTKNQDAKIIGNSGVYNLPGYSIAHWVKPTEKIDKAGSIIVSVTVSSSGKVMSAKVVGGSEYLLSNEKLKTACEKAALKCSFKLNLATTKKTQKGTITYKVQ